MSTELHLTIRAETAGEALLELAQISARAATELRGVPTPADTKQPELPLPEPAKGDGADTPQPTKRRGKARAAESEPALIDRNAIIKDLTAIFMKAEPAVRDKITAFRDAQGVQRLRELKDEALPGAAALLAELQQDYVPL